jgi:hypothetical protein
MTPRTRDRLRDADRDRERDRRDEQQLRPRQQQGFQDPPASHHQQQAPAHSAPAASSAAASDAAAGEHTHVHDKDARLHADLRFTVQSCSGVPLSQLTLRAKNAVFGVDSELKLTEVSPKVRARVCLQSDSSKLHC